MRPEALYPGGSYPTFMAQWKQQLELNSYRRRRLQLLEKLRRRLAETAGSGSSGEAHEDAMHAAAAAGLGSLHMCAADLDSSDGYDGLSDGDSLDQAFRAHSMLSAAEDAIAGSTNGTQRDSTDNVFSVSAGGRAPHSRKLTQDFRWRKVLYNNGAGVDVDGKYTGLWAYADIMADIVRDGVRSVKVRHRTPLGRRTLRAVHTVLLP